MTILTDLQKHYAEIGKSYTKFYTDKVKALTTDVTKELTYISTLDTEMSGLVDDISNVEDLGEAIDMASALCSAFEENPLVAQLMGQIEREYGISITSPLELTKMVVTGGDHPYFKVASAMIRFPLTGSLTSAKLYTITDIVIKLSNMVSVIDPTILAEMVSQNSTDGGIPGDVIVLLNSARAKLATPHLDGPYKSAIADVQSAIDELSDAKLWFGTEVSNISKLALTTALNSTYSELNKYWPEIKTSLTEMNDAITTINFTTITPAGAGKRMGKIRKIRTDIAREVQKMSDPAVPQGPVIPQYIIALGAIKKMLELSQPRPSDGAPSPVVTAIGAWDMTIVNDIESLMNKIINFTKRPYTVAAFAAYCSSLQARVDDYMVMYANTVIEVNSNWPLFPGVRELLDSIKGILGAMGFDNAADALNMGEIDKFADMNELTALSTGSAYVAMTQLASIGYQLGLFGLKDSLDKLKSEAKKKLDKQKFENKAKKKNRLDATKKRLDRLNESFEKFTSFYGEIAGMIEALANIVEINTV